MAEPVVGLRIQLNGIDKVVTDVKTLETELRKAKEDLEDIALNFGTNSESFKKLNAEVIKTEKELRKIKDVSQKITPEKSIEGFSKLGAGISASFAAATAAVSLFGNESEAVQKAATDAQNLLTIALSIRGAAEVVTGAQIVAKTIAEKASTLATNASNSATKALYTTLSKNPYGLIIAAVGALVSAYLLLRDETEKVNKAAESQKKIDELTTKSKEDLIRKTTEQSIKLKALKLIVNDTKKSELERNQALSELKKELPGLTGLELSRANSLKLINAEIENGLSLGKLEIQSQAIIAVGVEKEIRLREIKGEKDKNNLEIAKLQKEIDFENRKDAPVDYSRQERLYDLEKDKNTIKEKNVKLDNEARVLNKDRNNLETEYDGIVVKLNENRARTNKIVEDYNKGLKDETKNTESANKVRAQRVVLLEKDIELYTAALQLQVKLASETYKLGVADAKVVETAKARVASLEALRAKLVETLPFEEQLALKLQETFAVVSDDAGRAFSQLTKDLETFSIQFINSSKTTDELKDSLALLGDFTSTFKEKFKDVVSEDTLKQIDKLSSNYSQLSVTLFEISKAKIEPPFDIPAFKKAFKDLSDLENEVVIFGPDAALKIRENAENQRKEFVRAFVALQNTTKEGEEKLNAIRNSPDFADEPAREAAIKKLQDGYKTAAETFFDGLKSSVMEINKFNIGIETTASKVELLNQKIIELKNNSELFGAFLLENRELFANAYDVDLTELAKNRKRADEIINEVGKKTYDKEKKFKQDVVDFERKLLEKGINISKLSYEQKLELLKDALAKEIVVVETAEQKKQKAQNESIENISKSLQQFNQLIGQTASLVAQSYAFQLKQLEDTSKTALEQVVGDTAEANQKRIELEKQYQLQKAEIEKRALIKSLQFQLVQAIADTAQAVVSNLEIPPLAIAIGVLGAIQVGLIAQQLAYAQSLAGGGKIRMGAGGMVVGPSHEMGGVSYAGGVNLEGGESVINRQSSLNYAGLLSQINQSGGGQPIINNPSNSLMEERLFQAISRANQQPIRAYVLNSEITSGQAINRRLDELATL
jgi:hypothetical protein